MKITKARLREIILEELQSETGIQENYSDDIFADNHYCIHHGGVEHNGTIKMAEAIDHNFNRTLGRVTHYDMKLSDGTILENVAAEDIQVTNASLAEEHSHGKRDDDDEDAKRAKELRDKRRKDRRPGTPQPMGEAEDEKAKAEKEAEEAARLRKKRKDARRDQPSYRRGLEEAEEEEDELDERARGRRRTAGVDPARDDERTRAMEGLKDLIAQELKNLL